MGAVGVVGSQDLADEDKEIVEPARGERRLDGCCSVPLAKLMVQDVGMRHIGASVEVGRRHGIDAVGMTLANPRPFQHDSKGSQINAFQNNRARYNADRLAAQVEGNLIDLLFQGEQISGDFAS